jgi:hypothetical protein
MPEVQILQALFVVRTEQVGAFAGIRNYRTVEDAVGTENCAAQDFGFWP